MPHDGAGVLGYSHCFCARCTLRALRAVPQVRGRQSQLRVVMQKVKVGRSDA